MNSRSLIFFVLWLMAGPGRAVELEVIPHVVVHDDRTFLRDEADKRYSVWTDETARVAGLYAVLGMKAEVQALKKGEIVAVFFNDTITEDLTQMVFNKTAGEVFADYADAGMRFKLKAPPEGKKYSHVTVVVFTPAERPSHLGMRGMVQGGLAEKL